MILRDNHAWSHPLRSLWFFETPKKHFPWNKMNSPIHHLQLVCYEMLFPIFSKPKEAKCQGKTWMSHSITSLTNITLTMLNIYSSFIAIQQNMSCIWCKQMQHHGYYGSTSFISSIMGTNEITFNINLQTINSPINISSLPYENINSLKMLKEIPFSSHDTQGIGIFPRKTPNPLGSGQSWEEMLSPNPLGYILGEN